MPVWKLEDGIHVGEIIKPHSYLGRARVAFFISGLEEVLVEGSFLFIEWNEKPVPYLIDEINWQDDKSALIKFADVDTEEAVNKLKKKNIFLSSEDVPEDLQDELAGIDFDGYEVVNEKGQLIGPVTEFIENDVQSLLQVNVSGKEVLIPFHENIILKIDHKKKKIVANPPEGLLDL